jgi:hypothetical protein
VKIGNDIIPIGENFRKGKDRIGRYRLPQGSIAFLDNHPLLCLAMRDLHAYAMQPIQVKPRHTIIFRVVDAIERDRIIKKTHEILGIGSDIAANFIPRIRQYHLIDSEHVAHICNRHGDPHVERTRGHAHISVSDFDLMPGVVDPRNIQNFEMNGESRRIVYERQYGNEKIVVVQELLENRGMSVKTMYRKR